MKKPNFKYLIFAAIVCIGVVVVSVYSCEKETIIPNESSRNSTGTDGFISIPGEICGEITQRAILNSKNQNVGKALIYNDTKDFYLVLNANSEYNFTNVYMHIADKFGDFPVDLDGNPILDEFEYSITDKPMSNARKFKIPLTEIAGYSHVSVAAQLVNAQNGQKVEKINIVWVEGKFYGTDKSGRSFPFRKTACLTTEGEPVSE